MSSTPALRRAGGPGVHTRWSGRFFLLSSFFFAFFVSRREPPVFVKTVWSTAYSGHRVSPYALPSPTPSDCLQHWTALSSRNGRWGMRCLVSVFEPQVPFVLCSSTRLISVALHLVRASVEPRPQSLPGRPGEVVVTPPNRAPFAGDAGEMPPCLQALRQKRGPLDHRCFLKRGSLRSAVLRSAETRSRLRW